MSTEDRTKEPRAGRTGRMPARGATIPLSSSLSQLASHQAQRVPGVERKASGGELVIGRGIQVKGQIGACKTLVVEGELDASVEVQSLMLLEGGLFKGNAVVERAELAGRLEGKLTVRGKLHLSPTARASGEIRYGRIVIEEGGEIGGDISVLPPGEAAPAEAGKKG